MLHHKCLALRSRCFNKKGVTLVCRKMAPTVYLALGIHAIGLLFYFIRAESFIKDALIAPLYFIVPTGVGLFILSLIGVKKIINSGATRLQVVLLATFLGFVIVVLSFVELTINRQQALTAFIYAIFYVISVIGYFWARELLEFDERAKNLFKTLLSVIPVLVGLYYFFYWYFSPYPLRDIFMETHFMKAAEEFSRWGYVNMAISDTIIPVYHVSYGLLNHFYGFNLMHGQWILPAYLSLFMTLCLYSFLSSFIKNRLTLAIALGSSVIFMNVCFSNSNNTFTTGIALLFFSFLVSSNENNGKGMVRVSAETFALTVLSVVFFKFRMIPSNTASILPYLMFYIVTLIIFINLGYVHITGYALSVLALMIAPQFHRAASLYMPLMLMLYWIYHACFRIRWNDNSKKQTLVYKIFAYSIISVPASLALAVFIVKYWPGIYLLLVKMIDAVGMAMVGEHFTAYEGATAAVADWLRFIPPMAHALFVAMIAYVFIKHRARIPEDEINVLLFATISLAVSIVLYLSPLPKVHRLIPFPVMMFVAILSVFVKIFINDGTYNAAELSVKPLRLWKIYAPVVLIVGSAVMYYLYRLPWKPDDISDYVISLQPLVIFLAVVMLAAFVLLFLTRKNNFAVALIMIAVATGLLLDKYQFMSKLYIKSYGMRLQESKVISHYTKLELNTAEDLSNRLDSPKTILFSDPFTLGIFEARTGNNGFYTFENLGQFMLPVYVEHIKAVLREAFPDDRSAPAAISRFDKGKSDRLKGLLDEFARDYKGAMPETRFALNRLTGMPRDYSANGGELGWTKEEYKDNIIWILNEKTVRWAWTSDDNRKFPNGEVGYYPMNGTFSDEYLKRYIIPYFEVLHNSENKVLVLRLK